MKTQQNFILSVKCVKWIKDARRLLNGRVQGRQASLRTSMKRSCYLSSCNQVLVHFPYSHPLPVHENVSPDSLKRDFIPLHKTFTGHSPNYQGGYLICVSKEFLTSNARTGFGILFIMTASQCVCTITTICFGGPQRMFAV